MSAAVALLKKMAGYHQFHAVNVAVDETLRAIRPAPLTVREGAAPMVRGRIPAAHPATVASASSGTRKAPARASPWPFTPGASSATRPCKTPPSWSSPTATTSTTSCSAPSPAAPSCSASRPSRPAAAPTCATKLQVDAGGVVFTTMQKFLPDVRGDRHPLLSDRRNIVVIADEAHRSQYDFVDGFAANLRDALPYASFIGFTGTPIELTDKNTRAVFGDYISIYDIQQAVADGATVPIYYESRLVQLTLDDSVKPTLDDEFDAVTEGEEVERRESLKTKWAQLEALVGADSRIDRIAADLVAHFERRLETLEGKGMVVCMSRRICVDLYNAIAALRPDWCAADDATGALKVVMTGSASDPAATSPTSAPRPPARRSPTVSATLPTPSAWSSCATCG